MRAFGCAVMLVVALTGCTMHTTYRITPQNVSDRKDGGVYYALPKSVVVVDAIVQTVSRHPGPFKDWAVQHAAELAIPAETIITSESTSCELDTVTISTRGVPDPEQIYVIKVHGGAFRDRNLSLALTQAGLMTDLTSQQVDRTVQFIEKSIETLAAIAVRASGVGAPTGKVAGPDPETDRRDAAFKAWQEVRTRRLALASADATQEGGMSLEVLERRFRELDRLEQAYLSLFTGYTRVKVKTMRREFEPKRDQLSSTLFFLSGPGGACAVETGGSQPVELKLELSERQRTLADTLTRSMPDPSTDQGMGYAYRLPVDVTATVALAGKERARQEVAIAQLGRIAWLPANQTGTSSKYVVNLYEAVGALKKVEVDTKGLETGTGEGVGRAIGSVLESQDEVKMLERRKKILELEKDIAELEKR